KSTGPMSDTEILNAALALFIAKKALSIDAAIQLARETLINGTALGQLGALRSSSRAVTA
ncbi:MAG: anthranilate phosphoribosyltransferase, partial [Leuconostoc sp.]|nr:anthranilate phosphoribosyltransferase [Leuconostoc sp.]